MKPTASRPGIKGARTDTTQRNRRHEYLSNRRVCHPDRRHRDGHWHWHADAWYFDYRKKRDMFALHHKERMAAIEKGVELPPLPAEFFQDGRRQRPRHPSDFLRRGLVLLFVGVAVTAAMYQSAPDAYLWGVIPGAIGIAYLLYYAVVGRKLPAPPEA
jgi:hypothetical protein